MRHPSLLYKYLCATKLHAVLDVFVTHSRTFQNMLIRCLKVNTISEKYEKLTYHLTVTNFDESMATTWLPTSSSPNPNLATFDKAVVLIESTPRQFKDLPSGETISFREYNKGQPHTLVMLPGYVCDYALFSVPTTEGLSTLCGYIFSHAFSSFFASTTPT